MSNKEYGGCVMNFSGSKARHLDAIYSILPKEDGLVVLDSFMGGGSLATQLPESWLVTANDISSELVEVHENLYQLMRKQGVVKTAEEVLSVCHSMFDKNNKNDKEHYIQVRAEYNKNPTPLGLYGMLCASFSNQIRFGPEGFNLPKGNRYYNPSMQAKMLAYLERISVRDITYTNKDFREFDFTNYDLVFADCPYYMTDAVYNSQGEGWTLKDSVALLSRLDRQHVSGGKFIMFEELYSKGKKNVALAEWASKYNIKQLGDNSDKCNYQRSGGRTQEIMVYNF